MVPYYKDKIIKNCEIGGFNINEKSGCFAMMACDASVGDENMETIYSQLLESEGYVFVGGGYMKETGHGPIFVEFEEGEGELDAKIYINRDSDGIYDAKKGDYVDERIPYPLLNNGRGAYIDKKNVISKNEIVYEYDLQVIVTEDLKENIFGEQYKERLRLYGFKADTDNPDLYIRKTADKKRLSVLVKLVSEERNERVLNQHKEKYQVTMKIEDIE